MNESSLYFRKSHQPYDWRVCEGDPKLATTRSIGYVKSREFPTPSGNSSKTWTAYTLRGELISNGHLSRASAAEDVRRCASTSK